MALLELSVFPLCAHKLSSTWLPQLNTSTLSVYELSDMTETLPGWESEETSSCWASAFSFLHIYGSLLFKWQYRAKSRLSILAKPADPVFSRHRMGQAGVLRLSLFGSLCLWTPVIGPFSVGALETGVVKCSWSQGTYAKSIALFLGAKWEWLLPASLAHLQDFKWAKYENRVFSKALVKPPKC